MTNLPASVPAERVALWYYWRWRIESYFKLLKSAGQQVEHWQQETASALLRRLLVASMACVLSWQIARSATEEGQSLRALLIRLSGRLVKREQGWTVSALLEGMWVLLAMVEVLQQWPPEQLGEWADQMLGGGGKFLSGNSEDTPKQSHRPAPDT